MPASSPTHKARVATLLQGGVSDAPPHWELVFQLEKEFFDIDVDAVRNASYLSDAAKRDAWLRTENEVFVRVVEKFGWAAVPAYAPEDVGPRRRTSDDQPDDLTRVEHRTAA